MMKQSGKAGVITTRRFGLVAILFTLLVSLQNSMAAEGIEYPVGEMVAYPILNLSLGYSNDVYYTESSADGSTSGYKGSFGGSLLAGAGIQGINRGHLYGLEYAADITRFADGDPADNQVDQRLVGYWGHAFSERHNIDVGFEYLDSHDRRGEEDPINSVYHSQDRAEPDEWHQTQVGGIYTFGAEGARGKLELATCYTCRRYDNNNQEYRDHDILDVGATLYARVAPKTYALLQIINTHFDYLNETSGGYTFQLDSTERRYLAGIKWEATRKTTGTLRVGLVEKEFDTGSGRQDYDNLLFDLGIDWRPNEDNFIHLGYMNRPYEAVRYDNEILDDFVDVQQIDLTWSRRWSPRITTSLSAFRGWDKYYPTGREDDRYGLEAGIRYKLKKIGTVGLRYVAQQRDSNFLGHDYDDQGVMLDFNLGQLFGFGEDFGGRPTPDICRIR